MTKIALLSDIHGNTTALEAVLADARQLGVDEYWLLGDILMPGTGRRRILDLLAQLPITARVLGNWEDSLWHGVRKELDSTRPSQRYLLRQCQYVLEEISLEEIELFHNQPLQIHRQFGDLTVGISHHLPDKNWGRELIHTGAQENFDRLVTNPPCDIAVWSYSPAVASLRDWWAINCQSGFNWPAFLSRCPVTEGLAGPVYDFRV